MDYRKYSFRTADWLEFIVRMAGKGLLICWLFYDSFRAAVLLLPFAVADYRKMKREKKRRRDQQLSVQFKGMIEAVAGSLQAGYSLERAFADARRDLELMYGAQTDGGASVRVQGSMKQVKTERQSPGERLGTVASEFAQGDTAGRTHRSNRSCEIMIFRELDLILAGLGMNIPLETLLKDFGSRSGNEDIRNFANVVLVAKRSGGNLIHIIQKTVQCMGDKLAVEEEIATMLAAKRLEERIMMVMPYGIILYLRIGSRGFFDVLYHNVPGILCMTAFLAAVYVAGAWGDRIMDIQV